MAPLLQRPVRPADHLLRRLLALALAACALVLAGWFGAARAPAPELSVSGPGHELEHARRLERLFAGARTRIWCALYVIRPDGDGPVQALLEALAAAARRGVDVRVVVDAGPDPFTGRDDGRNDAASAWLRAQGVRVVPDEDGRTTHAKLMVVDGRQVVAGSHNWTRAALTANREVSLLVDDQACARRAEQVLEAVPGFR